MESMVPSFIKDSNTSSGVITDEEDDSIPPNNNNWLIIIDSFSAPKSLFRISDHPNT